MNAGDLIKILQVVDPSQEVEFSIGGLYETQYRQNCAKVELQGGDCLNFLYAKGAEILSDGDTPFLTITLEQVNWPIEGFIKEANAYDREYKKFEE